MEIDESNDNLDKENINYEDLNEQFGNVSVSCVSGNLLIIFIYGRLISFAL